MYKRRKRPLSQRTLSSLKSKFFVAVRVQKIAQWRNSQLTSEYNISVFEVACKKRATRGKHAKIVGETDTPYFWSRSPKIFKHKTDHRPLTIDHNRPSSIVYGQIKSASSLGAIYYGRNYRR